MVEYYYCPNCGKDYLGLSPDKYRFSCAFCNKKFMIQEITKYVDDDCKLIKR